VRYTNESNRLKGVLGKPLSRQDFICGQLSIADFAGGRWGLPRKSQGVVLEDFQNPKAPFQRVGARESSKMASNRGRKSVLWVFRPR